MSVKYYSVDEAVRMFPYLKTYIRDIKYTFSRCKKMLELKDAKLKNLITTDKVKREKIERLDLYMADQIELFARRYWRWRDELSNLHIHICNARYGCLDVPVLDDYTRKPIMLCVDLDSNKANLKWHSVVKENFRNAKPYVFWERTKDAIT